MYAAIVVDGSGAQGNAGIIDLGDATVVFDTFLTPRAAEDLRAAAERLTGRSATYVIHSHRHGDHIFGNQQFAGAVVIAAESVRDGMHAAQATWSVDAVRQDLEQHVRDLEQARAQTLHEVVRDALSHEIADKRALLDALPDLRVRLPGVTFHERLTLHGAKREAQVFSYGAGHSDSDAALLLPDERILFAGDLVAVQAHPFLGAGDVEQWLATLDRFMTLDVHTVVPGHGVVGTREDVRMTRDYITEMLAQTRSALQSGRSADDVKAHLPAQYASWGLAHVYEWNVDALFARDAGRG